MVSKIFNMFLSCGLIVALLGTTFVPIAGQLDFEYSEGMVYSTELNEIEKEVSDYILDAVKDNKKNIFLWRDLSDVDLDKVLHSFILDYPEFMNFDRKIKLLSIGNFHRIHLEYNKVDVEGAITMATGVVNEAPKGNERETVQYIYNWLCDNVEYDVTGKNAFNSYGALCDGKAVCSGYAEAASIMLSMAGIDNYMLSEEINGVGHRWNKVNVDGTWYEFDASSGDRYDRAEFFLHKNLF